MNIKAQKYIDGVLSGEIVVCKYVRQAVQRHIDDLARAEELGLYFDEEAAEHATAFIEKYLHHTTGRWCGQSFILEGWQCFIVAVLFGWKRREDGSRRYRIAHVELGRKNGKSCLAAGLALYCLTADKEPRAEVYVASTKRDQSLIVFSEAQRMVRTSETLKRFAKVLAHSIVVPENFAKLEPLGADADSLDGLNISCCIADEVHAWKGRDVWDKLITATGARRQPLTLAITTAGADQTEASICWVQREHALQVLAGEARDDSFFCFIATLDEGDDWHDPMVWIKANPNLGVSLRVEDLAEEVERVKQAPTGRNAFLRYRMNVWTAIDTAWVTEEAWRASSKTQAIDPEALVGQPCYLGLDLAAKIDTCALVLVFPPETEGDEFKILPYFLLPGKTLAFRERNERVPWTDWKAKGLIRTSPGKTVDNETVLGLIRELDQRYMIRDIIFDRWGMSEILPQLESMGWCSDPKNEHEERYLIMFGQGYRDMSPAVKHLEELVQSNRLNHGNHPVLAWQVSCVSIVTDDAANQKFSKKRSKGRIDGPVALAMAAYRAQLHHFESVSVYESRGITVINLEG